MSVDTSHIKKITDIAQAKQLASHYYIRSRKVEADRDSKVRQIVSLSERIIVLEAKLAVIADVISDG